MSIRSTAGTSGTHATALTGEAAAAGTLENGAARQDGLPTTRPAGAGPRAQRVAAAPTHIHFRGLRIPLHAEPGRLGTNARPQGIDDLPILRAGLGRSGNEQQHQRAREHGAALQRVAADFQVFRGLGMHPGSAGSSSTSDQRRIVSAHLSKSLAECELAALKDHAEEAITGEDWQSIDRQAKILHEAIGD